MNNVTENKTVNVDIYLDFLRRANIGELPCFTKLNTFDARVVQELINSGLLSDARTNLGMEGGLTFHQTIHLTPEGAITLQNWERSKRENSIWYKVGSALVRFLWIFVGAVLALLSEFIKWLGT